MHLSAITQIASKLTPIKKSALQLKVLGLYAEFIRLARHTPGLRQQVRDEFRAHQHLSVRTDSLLIDYKLRRARNQLSMLKASRVHSVKTVYLENKKQ